MIRHAVRNVRAYSRIEARLGSEPRLSDLPQVNGLDLLDRFHQFRSRDALRHAPQLARQNGPLGERLAVLQDQSVLDDLDAEWRSLDPSQDLNLTLLRGQGDTPPYFEPFCRRFPQLLQLAPPADDHPLSTLHRLAESKPDILIASTESLDFLSGALLDSGEDWTFRSTVYLLGFPLCPWQIERVAEVFGRDLHQQLEWFEGLASLHSNGNALIPTFRTRVEILDRKNEPAVNDEPGSLVLTCTQNLSMPLLRYRTGVVARWREPQNSLEILGSEAALGGNEAANRAVLRCLGAGPPRATWSAMRQAALSAEGDLVRIRLVPGMTYLPEHERVLRSWVRAADPSVRIEVEHCERLSLSPDAASFRMR